MVEKIQKILDIAKGLDPNSSIKKSGNSYNIVTSENTLEFNYRYDEYYDCNRYDAYLDSGIIQIPESIGDFILSTIDNIIKQQKNINIR